jgi:hypothetical protein
MLKNSKENLFQDFTLVGRKNSILNVMKKNSFYKQIGKEMYESVLKNNISNKSTECFDENSEVILTDSNNEPNPNNISINSTSINIIKSRKKSMSEMNGECKIEQQQMINIKKDKVNKEPSNYQQININKLNTGRTVFEKTKVIIQINIGKFLLFMLLRSK